MHISLRKAAALQTSIAQAVAKLTISTTYALSVFDAKPLATLALEGQKRQEMLTLREQLQVVLYDIRKAVARANAQSGVSDLLADIARLTQEMSTLESLIAQPVRESDDTLTSRLQAIANANAKADSITESLYLSLMDSRWHEALQTKLSEVKRQRQRLQDQLADLNSKHSIALSEAAVALLEAQALL